MCSMLALLFLVGTCSPHGLLPQSECEYSDNSFIVIDEVVGIWIELAVVCDFIITRRYVGMIWHVDVLEFKAGPDWRA